MSRLVRRGAFSGALAALLVAGLLGACGGEKKAEKPPPQELTRDAVGYFCGMIVVDHKGPKAQILLKGKDEPLWFTSVRDAVAFTMLPEEPKDVAAIYVNDMGRASWDSPEPGTWIDAESAYYVIESEKQGGMGLPEAVPFADADAAKAFVGRFGGRIVGWGEIPRSYIFPEEAEGKGPPSAAENEAGGRGAAAPAEGGTE